jgi:HK97 family phage prohead protease
MVMVPIGQIERVDPSRVMMRGHAAVTGNEFTYFDPFKWTERRMVIDPGAFASVLDRLPGPLPIHWRHRTGDLQLGETTELREDSRGLYFESSRLFAHTESVDILTVMHGRERTGASILFEFGEVAEDDDGLEHILSFSKLHEIGPSPQGVNPLAYAELVELDSEAKPEPAVAPDSDAAMAAEAYRALAQIRSL